MNLRFEHITHVYRSPDAEDRQILDIPIWEIEAGQQVLLRGVSGSGKTTLFNIAAGLLHPTTGNVYYDDQALFAMAEAERDQFRARHIGYVFQSHYLLPTLTALENVIMPMAFGGLYPSGEWRDRARVLLGEVGLGDHLRYRPAQLSTGQRMRVAVVRALANKPRVILADEPTAALDAESGRYVMDLLQKTCQSNHAILMVASHDPALTTRFDTVANLQAGLLSVQEPARI